MYVELVTYMHVVSQPKGPVADAQPQTGQPLAVKSSYMYIPYVYMYMYAGAWPPKERKELQSCLYNKEEKGKKR